MFKSRIKSKYYKISKLFEDSIHYIMECPLLQNENFKVKCKGHNFYSELHIYR